jgi:putative MATE family efflux protein
MMISNSLNMAGPTIDMIWVGKLGSVAIAAVGVAGIGVMVMMTAMMGLMMGARAIIARFIGASDVAGANHAARQAFVLSGIFSIVMALIGIFFAERILVLLGVAADVAAEGTTYMRIVFVGSVAMAFRMVTEAIMQASGDTMTPMRITLGTRIFHVVLCPFLIFGWWIFPRLGVSGAALTNVMSQSLGVVFSLWFLYSGRTRIRLTLSNFRLDPNMIWRMVKIGVPGSIAGMQRTVSQLIMMRIVISFGTLALAAHTLSQRVEMILFMPGMALGMAAGVLAGQNLGAGQPERAERSGWLAVGMVEGLMLTGSAAILIAAESIVGIFSTEPELVAIASTFLRIAVAGYVMMGPVAVLQQCLMGVGDTVPPMIAGLATIWAVQVPLAFILPEVTGLGVYGVRWAMVAGPVLGAIVYPIYFRTGRWKRKKV